MNLKGILMILNLFRRKKSNTAIVTRQYDELTDAARQVAFYQDMNVPDTVLGRFDMISIHMMLYLRAVKDKGEAIEGLAQEIVDAFFEDIDHSIRELGIGDAGVPKRMKKLASMFYGRVNSYGNAIDNQDSDELCAALVRNLYPENKDTKLEMNTLSNYIISTDAELHNITHDTMLQGQLKITRI